MGSNTLRAVALCLVSVPVLAIAGGWGTVLAATDPGLGTALSFAALGGSTVTNTGPSVITGDLGVWPGSSVTGFPPGVLNGTQHLTDAVALQAQSDLTTAYNAAAAQPPTQDLTGQDLGGKVLIPGVYRFSSSAQLTGALTLDGQGAKNSIFIFQIGSTLTTASASTVSVINGASACDVWWQIGSSATLGTTTTLRGNLMALTSITLTTGANIPAGRALARNGALTMDTNTISAPTSCGVTSSSGVPASPSPGSEPTVASSGTPSPGTPGASPPGPPRLRGGPPIASAGPPNVSPSPRVPVTGATPGIGPPNTGLGGLMNDLIQAASLVVLGVVLLIAGRRRSVTG